MSSGSHPDMGLGFLEHLPGALIQIHLASRQVVYLNAVARHMFKYDADVLEGGLPLRKLFPDDHEYARTIQIVETFGLESFQNATAYTRHEGQDLYDVTFLVRTAAFFMGNVRAVLSSTRRASLQISVFMFAI